MCLFVISLASAFGQGLTLAGSGYSDPSVIHVAPGQITTLFVTGLKSVPSQPISATSFPLPTQLGGISVTLNQGGTQSSTSVPLLSIRQLSVCGGGGTTPPLSGSTADCIITAITVEVPFELALPTTTTVPLVVNENDNVTQAFRVSPVWDNLHVVNICDAFPPVKVTSSSQFCGPLVTHADGTLVNENSPAQPAEEIVIWAYGLGQTSPTAKTGQSSPLPAATLTSPLYLQFDFRTNAMPSPPLFKQMSGTAPPTPVFAGLTPGQIGLYQINVILPSTIPPVNACGPTCPGHVACSIYSWVQSNLTIDIGASSSWDGAAICVASAQ